MDSMELHSRLRLYVANCRPSEHESQCDEEAALLSRFEVLMEEEFGLNEMGKLIATRWFRQMAQPGEASERLSRVRSWLLARLSGRPRCTPSSSWQRGCPDVLPGLRALPFWPLSGESGSHPLGWVRELEASFGEIRRELLAVRGSRVFQPYRAPSWANPALKAPDGVGSLGHDSGDWNVLYLLLHNVRFEENCARFPATMRALRAIPRLYEHAFFSALAPGTHIAKHHGPTNKKLRCHLPLVVPPESQCRLRAGEETRAFVEGKCTIFDDSFEHEAWNDDPACTRICLIVDVWHPDLSDLEVTLLRFLEKGKMSKAKKLCEAAAEAAAAGAEGSAELGDNFYSLLEATSQLAMSPWDLECRSR